jgi:ssDNA-binding Zn-finger/Zn-ribbon topoisomerase 1
MQISKILKSKIYWQTMADRLNEKDMKKIFCKKCGENQTYKQFDDGVNWIICSVCGYKERLFSYFKKYDLQTMRS